MPLVLAFVVLGACAARPPETPQPTQIERPERAWSASMLAELRSVTAAVPAQGLPVERAALAELDRLDLLSQRDARAALQLDEAANALFERLALAFAMGVVDPAGDALTTLLINQPKVSTNSASLPAP